MTEVSFVSCLVAILLWQHWIQNHVSPLHLLTAKKWLSWQRHWLKNTLKG